MLLSGLTTSSMSRILDWLITTPGCSPPLVKSRIQGCWAAGVAIVSAEVSKVVDGSIVCGNICSSSAPLGTNEKVGRVVRVGMDIDAGNKWISEGVDRRRVATVAPFLGEERYDRRSL